MTAVSHAVSKDFICDSENWLSVIVFVIKSFEAFNCVSISNVTVVPSLSTTSKAPARMISGISSISA